MNCRSGKFKRSGIYMQLFYAPDIHPGIHHLSEEESKHCVKVLRYKTGDIIHFTDGKGILYHAELVSDNPKRCSAKIINTKKAEPENYKLHIAIAPTKNITRFEWFLEKATEIGIDEITPIICENSERETVKYNRLEKIIISALKQSLKTYLPKLNELESFNSFIVKEYTREKYIAYIDENYQLTLKSEYKKGSNVTILIGPEGDFSKKEVELAIQKGFNPISLGKSRLRTETAGVVACHTISLLND